MNQARKYALAIAYRAKSQGWRILNQGRKRGLALLSRKLRLPSLKRIAFDRMMARGLVRLPNRDNPVAPETARQILVFGDMGLGNFLMFTPALEALRKRYPDAEIVALFLKGRGAEIIAEGNPNIDRIVTIDMPKKAGLRPFTRLIRACRARNIQPDVVIARWNGSPYVSMLTMWLKPATRVGHVTSGGFKGYFDKVFNFPVKMTEEAHEVERNLDLVRALGAEPVSRKMLMPISAAQRDDAKRLVESRDFDPSRLICLQTGSSQLQFWKRWPAESWSVLADRLVALGYDIAFIGSADEADIADGIIAQTKKLTGQNRRNICGELSVNATGALLEMSCGIICNDSGLMHVAAAVGTPIVGLFGPTEFDRTRPYVDNCVVLRKPCSCNHGTLFDRPTLARIEACERPCLVGTTPDEVVGEVVRFMPLKKPAAAKLRKSG